MRKICKCTLRQSKSQFLGHLEVGVVNFSRFRLSFESDEQKNGCQLFWEKSAPPDKILATPMFTNSTFTYPLHILWHSSVMDISQLPNKFHGHFAMSPEYVIS